MSLVMGRPSMRFSGAFPTSLFFQWNATSLLEQTIPHLPKLKFSETQVVSFLPVQFGLELDFGSTISVSGTVESTL